MKRKLSLLMAFMMAATLVPATPSIVHADSNNTIVSVKSTTSDGFVNATLKITGEDDLVGKDGIKAGNKFYINFGTDADVKGGVGAWVDGEYVANKKAPDGKQYSFKNFETLTAEQLGGKTFGQDSNGKFVDVTSFSGKFELPADKESAAIDEALLGKAVADLSDAELKGIVASGKKLEAADVKFAVDMKKVNEFVASKFKLDSANSFQVKFTKTADNKVTVEAPLKDGAKYKYSVITDADLAELAAKGAIVATPVTDAKFESDYQSSGIKDAKKEELTKAILENAKNKKEILEKLNNDKTKDTIVSLPGYEKYGFEVPFGVKFDGASGVQKITIDGDNSSVKSGDLTYANIGDEKVKVVLDKKEKISRSANQEINLSFREVVEGSFKDAKKFTLRLPVNFAWKTVKDIDGIDVNEDNDRELVVNPKVLAKNSNYRSDSLNREDIKLSIVPNRDAVYGDVDVTIDGSDVTPSSLVVAEYVPYGVTVKADKVLSVIAGKDLPGKYVSKLTVEEPATGGFIAGRYMEFKFVDEKGEEVDASLQDSETIRIKEESRVDAAIDGSSIDGSTTKDEEDSVYIATANADPIAKADQWDIKIKKGTTTGDKAGKFKLEVPFVVASDFTGKLFLKVKGAGADEQLVQIADVKAPVTFEVQGDLPQVKIGLQRQKGADILVKETEAAALQDYVPASTKVVDKDNNTTKATNKIKYSLNPSENFAVTFKSAIVSVTEGDLSIKEKKSDDAYDSSKDGNSWLQVTVDRRSTKPSTIKFEDITMTLDRTVPYGKIQLKGNFGAVGYRHDLTNKVKKIDYINTVTPVKEDKRVYTVFKIGDTTYYEQAGGTKDVTKETMNVAPFAQDGRTMLPVRYIANALGASTNWDQNTKTATFMKDSTVVAIQLNQKFMTVNGTQIPLYTGVAHKDGRIFLPLANIAQAFGLVHGQNLLWNQEDQTVTILPQDATPEEIEEAKAGKLVDTSKAEEKKEDKKEEAKADDKKADEKKADEAKAETK